MFQQFTSIAENACTFDFVEQTTNFYSLNNFQRDDLLLFYRVPGKINSSFIWFHILKAVLISYISHAPVSYVIVI